MKRFCAFFCSFERVLGGFLQFLGAFGVVFSGKKGCDVGIWVRCAECSGARAGSNGVWYRFGMGLGWVRCKRKKAKWKRQKAKVKSKNEKSTEHISKSGAGGGRSTKYETRYVHSGGGG